MSKHLESAKGHSKNARNQLRAIRSRVRRDEPIDERNVEYTLDEVLAAIDEIEKEME